MNPYPVSLCRRQIGGECEKACRPLDWMREIERLSEFGVDGKRLDQAVNGEGAYGLSHGAEVVIRFSWRVCDEAERQRVADGMVAKPPISQPLEGFNQRALWVLKMIRGHRIG